MHVSFPVLIMTAIIYQCAKSHQKSLSNDIKTPETCECVLFLLCQNGTEIIHGDGLIDTRIKVREKFNERPNLSSECDDVLHVCCEPSRLKSEDKHEKFREPPPSIKRSCGQRNFANIGLKIMSKTKNEAEFGEFPWMVAILHSNLDNLDVYQCGGSLIHPQVVLTAAHCVQGKDASALKIRAGEWDSQSTNESLPHQDRGVQKIVIHERFHRGALLNNFALLVLRDPVTITDHVNVVCLPESGFDYDESACLASGWGKDKFGKGGKHQTILKKVFLSMVSSRLCQRELRYTRLGKSFELHKSFLCAGGVPGEDTCKGDGGSPLVCPLKANPRRYVQVGIVSWGIGCGSDLPAVYASIPYARAWIDDKLMLYNLDNRSYQQR